MNKPHVLVIGGGILGATTACQLALASVDVTLIDPMVDDSRASAGSLAWLNVSSTSDPAYGKLRLASMHLWHRLADIHPNCPVRFFGALYFGKNPDAINTHSVLLDSLGWPVKVLDARELSRRIPQMENAPEAALLAPHEGTAHPERITTWMLQRARSFGVNIVPGRVSRIRA